MIHLIKKAHVGGAQCLRLITLVALFALAIATATAEENKAQLDVTRLAGVDPADIVNTDNTHRVYPYSDEGRKHTFLLMNVGTQQFFNIGGSYGRHASLRDYGMLLWIYKNSKTDGTYNIRTRLNMVAGTTTTTENLNNENSYVQYIDNDKLKPGVYLEANSADATREFGWFFEQADGYSKENKVYKIRTYGNHYLTATPNDANDNFCEAVANATPDNPNYCVWKLITLEEYYRLFNTSPSNLSAPIDATFMLQSPGFSYNLSNMAYWIPTGDPENIRFGVDECYKKPTEAYYKGGKENDKSYICENGKYFAADIKNSNKTGLDQMVNVHKPGWYIIRCNGFSNTNGQAKLFVSEAIKYQITGEHTSKVALNQLDANGITNLLEAGKAFYAGKYENEVMIHVSEAELKSNEGTVTLVFGIVVGDNNTTFTNAWTAFDNFRMLYAGEYEGPSLVLDEDNPDLSYLTETSDEYKNVVLHLNRTFTLNKWNTLTLPVDLTYGQMKRAFGDEMMLAELYQLNANSVRFKTVNRTNDDKVMLTAYTPYIIKPTKEADDNVAYTTPRLKKAANQYWLGENEGKTYDKEGVTRYTAGQVSIKAGHYDIPNVTLNRKLLTTNLDDHWVSTTTTSASTNDMVCKGTMAKTYYVKDGKGMFYTDNDKQRDDLSGDYFMNKGTMYKVHSTKQYGLKAFRCWFELTGNTDNGSTATAPAKEVSLVIDDIEDNTTGIDTVVSDPSSASAKAHTGAGVYNLNGQLVRPGTSLDGLPKGIYIVNGKKVKK
ncbi:MAG: hypothetical protein MR489_09280 [Prevotella sp.]|nr:hypothetical protein [Prevotella sp.]